MEITVYVEKVEGNGYRATSMGPIPASAEAPTEEQALIQVREKLRRSLESGKVVKLQVPIEEHPLAKGAGWLKDDPLFDEWKKGVEEYRRQRDAEANESP